MHQRGEYRRHPARDLTGWGTYSGETIPQTPVTRALAIALLALLARSTPTTLGGIMLSAVIADSVRTWLGQSALVC